MLGMNIARVVDIIACTRKNFVSILSITQAESKKIFLQILKAFSTFIQTQTHSKDAALEIFLASSLTHRPVFFLLLFFFSQPLNPYLFFFVFGHSFFVCVCFSFMSWV